MGEPPSKWVPTRNVVEDAPTWLRELSYGDHRAGGSSYDVITRNSPG
ncbi:MAG TPA: hypothetical protein VGJ44_26730 [Kribbellaceae bacterium]